MQQVTIYYMNIQSRFKAVVEDEKLREQVIAIATEVNCQFAEYCARHGWIFVKHRNVWINPTAENLLELTTRKLHEKFLLES